MIVFHELNAYLYQVFDLQTQYSCIFDADLDQSLIAHISHSVELQSILEK